MDEISPIQIIMDVLEEHQSIQVNLGSETARIKVANDIMSKLAENGLAIYILPGNRYHDSHECCDCCCDDKGHS